MTVVELFAGAGGASLGLLSAGFEEVRAVEWNADACETRRAAGLRCDEGDVRDPAHYAGVTADAVWSSFPCQAWSTAGRRLGKDDPRNGWPWTVDVLDQVRPTWFMGENVPGLTFHKGECARSCVEDCARLYFEETILRDLRQRFAWVGWSILDAARFGVSQNRERLFIVAGPRPIVWPVETHAPPEELRQAGLFGERRRAWATMREALNIPPGFRVVGGGSNPREPGKPEDRTYRDITDEPSTTVAANQIGNAGPFVCPIPDADAPVVPTRAASRPELLDRPSPTVTTCEVKGTRGENQHGGPDRASDAAWLGAGGRRLTPAECAKLMAFPDDHPWRGTKTSIYAQIGNGCCPPVVEALARAVRSA